MWNKVLLKITRRGVEAWEDWLEKDLPPAPWNRKQRRIIGKGAKAWNEWRATDPAISTTLSGANFTPINLKEAPLGGLILRGADLSCVNLGKADLIGADLGGANLVEAKLQKARLYHANLRGVRLARANVSGADLRFTNLESARVNESNLSGANLSRANLFEASLSNTDLRGAKLDGAKLIKTDLIGANFEGVTLAETSFVNVDLSSTKGLDDCLHSGHCVVDHRTLIRSKEVPLTFWRGCGLPDHLIDYLPSLTGDAIQFYSCFISHSTKDLEFAERLHADLQNSGVRCWFSPHDMEIGGDIWDDIDQAIRTRDKIVLILSEDALGSGWIEDEVKKGFAEERARDQRVLFPVRIDDAVMDSNEPWATKLRDNRLIGDFTAWKNHDAYKLTFERVLRDLKKAS